ncbi:TPA: hypothetical protein ACN6ZQ_000253, partial [Escherichia albertii]
MGKGGSKGHTPREAKDNLKSSQMLSVIDAISEGPIEGPVDGLKSVLLNSTPVLDSEGNTNISGVTVVFRAGEQEQTPPEGFESSGSETVLGTEVKYDTPITRTITSANIDRLRFTFGVQALVETESPPWRDLPGQRGNRGPLALRGRRVIRESVVTPVLSGQPANGDREEIQVRQARRGRKAT